MSKLHINDTPLFWLLELEVGGYKALTIAFRIFRELENGK